MSTIPDTSYETYDARAAGLIAQLDRVPPSEKADDLADRLTKLIGSESPRLISALAQADAFVKVANFEAVGPESRARLGPLMRYYAAKPHPFTSCVNDNTKRFGKDRAERICSVLKDLIIGNTRWRGGKAAPVHPVVQLPPASLDSPVTPDAMDDWIEQACAALAAELNHPEEVKTIERWLLSLLDREDPEARELLDTVAS
jgi:hypothetical protein